jgi:hypothetical protein
MTRTRRLLAMTLVAVLALALAAVALAAPTPGRWAGGKMSFSVSDDGKRIVSFSYQCEPTSAIAKPFPEGKGPKIRKNGRFSFKGKAVRFRTGVPVGEVKGVIFKGRFVSDGKAKGRFKGKSCKAGKWSATPE